MTKDSGTLCSKLLCVDLDKLSVCSEERHCRILDIISNSAFCSTHENEFPIFLKGKIAAIMY
jgi:hypothetical protein